ncbi:MAG: DUF2634 domain-containing protein [Eubacteriales bacterium]|nr:DUF2634 domain-containing protein [Eubacteriales bacterium]
MLPEGGAALRKLESLPRQPSRNYRMLIDSSRVLGMCDGKEAMKQVIYKILNTERYRYVVYSWNYGIELLDLFGKPVDYVCPVLEKRITEALTQDDRITEVRDFAFETSRAGRVHASFTVVTDVGEIQAEKEVQI